MQSILLIDDLLETALTFGRNADRPVLLFGDYEWNKRVDAGGPWTFDDKLALEGGNEWWKDDTIGLHSEDRIWMVRSWYNLHRQHRRTLFRVSNGQLPRLSMILKRAQVLHLRPDTKLPRDLEVRFIDCAENDAIVHQSLQGLPM